MHWLKVLPGCPVRVGVGPIQSDSLLPDLSFVLDVVSAAGLRRRSFWAPEWRGRHWALGPGLSPLFPEESHTEGWWSPGMLPSESVEALIREACFVVAGVHLSDEALAFLAGQLREPRALAVALSVMES